MVVAATVFATATPAQTVDVPAGSEDVILGAWSDPAKCNHTNAVHLAFDAVLERGDKLNGTCVAVKGFWASRALFGRASQGNANRSNSTRSLRGRRIGIYAQDQILERAPQRAARYTMVGIVGQCETEWPGAMMVLGYCHYTGGPILQVAEVIPDVR
jgi:hypothetical protein